MAANAEPAPDFSAMALAGVVQVAALVHRTANGEGVDDDLRRAVLRTITTHQAEHYDQIFPDPAALRYGAGIAMEVLNGRTGAPEVLRYTLQLMDIARLLRGVPQVVEKLRHLLDEADAADADDARYARIYQQTISTLGKRIQVTGDPNVLQREETAERIRALLLAGVRLAWLWQQQGGRRWHLIFRRGPLIRSLAGVGRTPTRH
jgi:high frequency lysogenization protein